MISLSADRHIFSVSELNNSVKSLLEMEFSQIWLEGEISNLVRARSGHIYFSLKDDNAQLRVAMFKSHCQKLRFPLKDGLQVMVRGRLSLYAPRGDYQLIADTMEEAGLGALQRAYEALRIKLQHEGLFDPANKRPLPKQAARLGVITSPTGAAIHDILSVAKRRYPLTELIIYPTLVQGKDAPTAIKAALAMANERCEVDALIIGRGGGSIEDLWCFNDESLARAIAASQLPTVSAVGHEIDFTIADFVADARAATPSAAAEMLCPQADELLSRLQHWERRLLDRMQQTLATKQYGLQHISARVKHPGRQLQDQMQRLDELDARLRQAMNRDLKMKKMSLDGCQRLLYGNNPQQMIQIQYKNLSRLRYNLNKSISRRLTLAQTEVRHLAQQLHSVSPLQTMSRGYSITSTESGTPVTQAKELALGQRLHHQLYQGAFISQVVNLIEPDQDSVAPVESNSGKR